MKRLNLYVASGFSNKSQVRAMQRILLQQGHYITYDWTQADASMFAPDSEAYWSYCYQQGAFDFAGVIQAHAFILLCHERMSDALVEMGIAIGAGKPVFVLFRERRQRSVFYGLPGVTVFEGDMIDQVSALVAKLEAFE